MKNLLVLLAVAILLLFTKKANAETYLGLYAGEGVKRSICITSQSEQLADMIRQLAHEIAEVNHVEVSHAYYIDKSRFEYGECMLEVHSLDRLDYVIAIHSSSGTTIKAGAAYDVRMAITDAIVGKYKPSWEKKFLIKHR